MQAPLNPGEWVIAECQVSESERDRLGGDSQGFKVRSGRLS
jgi:hypothetical protein